MTPKTEDDIWEAIDSMERKFALWKGTVMGAIAVVGLAFTLATMLYAAQNEKIEECPKANEKRVERLEKAMTDVQKNMVRKDDMHRFVSDVERVIKNAIRDK